MRKTSFPCLIELSHASIVRAVERHMAKPTASRHVYLVDGTCGNGHDTLFLCSVLHQYASEKSHNIAILSFDIQPEGLNFAQACLSREYPQLGNRVSFLLEGHEHLVHRVGSGADICVAMYNLGFLPRSEKQIVTKPETTLASLDACAALLLPEGLISVHSYGGHEGGRAEMAAVERWFAALPEKQWKVMRYSCCNKTKNPEIVFLAEKLPERRKV